MGVMARICLVATWGLCESLDYGSQPKACLYIPPKNLHLSVDDPVEVFLPFIRATRTTFNGTKQTGFPVDAFVCTFGGFLPLAIFDLGLLICGGFVVPGDDCVDGILP